MTSCSSQFVAFWPVDLGVPWGHAMSLGRKALPALLEDAGVELTGIGNWSSALLAADEGHLGGTVLVFRGPARVCVHSVLEPYLPDDVVLRENNASAGISREQQERVLKQLRAGRGPGEIARVAGISERKVHRIMSGVHRPCTDRSTDAVGNGLQRIPLARTIESVSIPASSPSPTEEEQ